MYADYDFNALQPVNAFWLSVKLRGSNTGKNPPQGYGGAFRGDQPIFTEDLDASGRVLVWI